MSKKATSKTTEVTTSLPPVVSGAAVTFVTPNVPERILADGISRFQNAMIMRMKRSHTDENGVKYFFTPNQAKDKDGNPIFENGVPLMNGAFVAIEYPATAVTPLFTVNNIMIRMSTYGLSLGYAALNEKNETEFKWLPNGWDELRVGVYNHFKDSKTQEPRVSLNETLGIEIRSQLPKIWAAFTNSQPIVA